VCWQITLPAPCAGSEARSVAPGRSNTYTPSGFQPAGAGAGELSLPPGKRRPPRAG